MSKASQRQFLITVSGVTVGFFAKKTGGQTSSTTSMTYDGGSTDPDLLSGPQVHSAMTVSRPYDPLRDQPVIRQMRSLVGKSDHTVTVQPCDTSFTAIGAPETFFCRLDGVDAPDVDAGSSNAAEFSLKFTVAKVS